jgi:hypothetical protein
VKVVGLQVVLDRKLMVGDQPVEVDHGIELAARAYPLVDLLTQRIPFRVVVPLQRTAFQRILEWRERTGNNAYIVCLRGRYELAIARDQLLVRNGSFGPNA